MPRHVCIVLASFLTTNSMYHDPRLEFTDKAGDLKSETPNLIKLVGLDLCPVLPRNGYGLVIRCQICSQGRRDKKSICVSQT